MAEEATTQPLRHLTAAVRWVRDAVDRVAWLAVRGVTIGLFALVLGGTTAYAASPKPVPRWHELTAQQRDVLRPLEAEWDSLDEKTRKNWLGVAKRYPKMTPIGQKRTQTRMTKWAKLTPEERQRARRSYKRLKDQDDLEKEWKEYQASKSAAGASGENRTGDRTRAKSGAGSAPAQPAASGSAATR